MPQYELDGKHLPAFKSLDYFTQGYLEAMFWTDCSPDSEELKDSGFADLAPESLAEIVADCSKWQETHKALLEQAYEKPGYDSERAGHDYHLTRCHHGAGFWDRGELGKELGEALTKAAHEAGETWLYLGDDQKVYWN